MVEAILWDNDGVLVDTECFFFESTRTILATIGIELSLEQFLDFSMRQGRSGFELAIESGWDKQQVANLKRQRDALYSEMLHTEMRVLPGVGHFIRACPLRTGAGSRGHSTVTVVSAARTEPARPSARSPRSVRVGGTQLGRVADRRKPIARGRAKTGCGRHTRLCILRSHSTAREQRTDYEDCETELPLH